MTDNPVTYRSLVSPRSRRLRTIGVLLLIAALGMALYGYFVLMPSLRTLPGMATLTLADPVRTPVATNVRPLAAPNKQAEIAKSGASEAAQRPNAGLSERERKAALAKIIFVYGYWSVCGVLLLALILVAWLDFRELTRVYEDQRQRLYFNSLATQSEEKESQH